MNVFSIQAESDIISEVTKIEIKDLKLSEPIPVGSISDVLDAPINPDDVMQIAEMVKAISYAGISVLIFAEKLKGILKNKKSKVKIKKNNKEKIIDENTSPEEIAKFLEE